VAKVGERWISAQKIVQELANLLWSQRKQGEPLVVRLLRPVGSVLGPEVDDEERAGARDRID
jgi:hypothetical protein